MNKELFVGIDPSLTGTGLTILDKDFECVKQQLICTTKRNGDIQDIEHRLIYITKQLEVLLEYKSDIKLILIEGLSYNSKGESGAQLAALHYFIRIWLLQHDLTYDVAPPTTLKKFVSGKGNCKKEIMIKEIYKKWGVDFNDNNLADSYGLARLAQYKYGEK